MTEKIDRYTLGDRIGQGGMAEVYQATAEGPHGFRKQVAIKRVHQRLANAGESYRRRFIQEARIAVGLTHPAIVQVLDFGSHDGQLFLAMEYVDGVDLGTVLRWSADTETPVPLRTCLHIALQLCAALVYAHDQGVVHRDVSPANVLLSREGAVKLGDFGIAKTDDAGAAEAELIAGKWRYMSPEQSSGDPVDRRSDVFSLGIVVHELLTAQPLFEGDTPEAIAQQIANKPIPALHALRAEVPDQLDQAVQRCLARAFGERAPDCRSFATELRETCRALGVVPSSDDVRALVREISRAHEPSQRFNDRLAQNMRGKGVGPGRHTVADPPIASRIERGTTVVLADLSPGDGSSDPTSSNRSTPPMAPAARPIARWMLIGGIAAGAIAAVALLADRDNQAKDEPRSLAPRRDLVVPERLYGTWCDAKGEGIEVTLSRDDVRIRWPTDDGESRHLALGDALRGGRLSFFERHRGTEAALAYSYVREGEQMRFNHDFVELEDGTSVRFAQERLDTATRELQLLPSTRLVRGPPGCAVKPRR